MRRASQSPLPGTGGRIRYGRAAAASSNTPPVGESDLPTDGYRTIFGPVLLNVSVPGEPIPKGRPRSMLAKLYGTGRVMGGRIIEGSGDLRLVQGHTYTPQATRDAEELWRAIIQARRTISAPTPENVGVLAFFRTTGRRADGDNLFKLLADAMNGTLLVDDQQISEHHVHLLRHCTEPGTDLVVYSTNRRTPRKPDATPG